MVRFSSISLGLIGGIFTITLSLPHPRPDRWNRPIPSDKFSFGDTLKNDTTRDTTRQVYRPGPTPDFRPKDRYGNPFVFQPVESPMFLKDPNNLKLDVDIDTSNNYTIYEKVGDINYRPISTMSFEQFQKVQEERMIKDYWRNKSIGLDGESAVSGRRLIPPIYISPVFDRIFGGSYVDIKPNGYVNLDFGSRWQRIDNPAIPIRQQRNGGFQFDQQINMNVVGKIGDKLSVTANFDNNNTFDFENNLKVEYTGYKEDIIKKIEVGNVSMPLNNSLINGSQNLFGIKTQLQFGKLFVTGLASTQRGKTNVINIQGGSQGQGREFQVRASDYDENRHFFLGQFFRDNYERWLGSLPQILSGVNVTRVEVYLINRNNNTQTLRNFAAFMDLGEGRIVYRNDNPLIGPGKGNVPSSNDANKLYNSLINDPNVRNADNTSSVLDNKYGLVKSTDYEVVTAARKLEDKEYFVNKQLGYISFYRKLQDDEALAVSYEYTYNGRRYKVGELTEDYQNVADNQVIFLKLLRPSKISTNVPTWNLMMKNIYNIATQITKDGFQLRVIYRDDRTGLDNPNLQEGRHTKDIPLVELFNLDRLNQNNDPQKDGLFDYVEGVTVNSDYGDIIFPVLEPFGKHLRSKFDPDEQAFIDKYVYDTLYNTTKSDAELDAAHNKFYLVGRVQGGSGSEIALPGINIAPGSVRVIAGNIPLIENVDYRVDYNQGKVSIINQSVLNSGSPIQIQYENSDLFNFQARSLFGTRAEYIFNDNMSLGATFLYHNERPLVSRVSIGDEPTRNMKWGLDYNYRSESRLLTKMVDLLPLVSTKEPSLITFSSEFAQLIPGTSNFVQGKGTSYIDDFESAVTPYNLENVLAWKLAATPKRDDGLFDGGLQAPNDLSINDKRAKLAWYIIDNVFYRSTGLTKPANISDNDLKNHYIRAVIPQEIYHNRDPEVVNTNETIFDLAYYPSERGPYNYNPNLARDGNLPNPKGNWGGITRAVSSDVDFDKTNIQYIEFWMMDPFVDYTNGNLSNPRGQIDDGNNPPVANSTGGKLIFDLGSISEDLMKDGRHAFENGLPADGSTTGTTDNAWGRVTTQQYLTNAFDNSASARPNQDVGLDGLKSSEEVDYFKDFLNKVNVTPDALSKIKSDPSADNFHYFLGADMDQKNAKILERYKNFNGMENNSPLLSGTGSYTPLGTTIPDNEDINGDNTISDLEEYYEYVVDLKPGQLQVGKNNIVDQVTNDENGDRVSWFLFRIPIKEPTRVQGNIDGFKSIRFIRTLLTGFSQPVVLRFAKFQFTGSQWRQYTASLREKDLVEPPENYDAKFTVSVVNLEENGSAEDGKIPYVLPPGIKQDIDNTSPILRRNNEQSMKLSVENLEDGDARSAFKDVTLDLINYGRVKMFFHAESEQTFQDTVTAFLRLGTDYTDNYYEIEVPLLLTPHHPPPYTQEEIWPDENNIDIALNDLYEIKSERNRAGFSISLPYVKQDGRYRVTIVGRPELSSVQILMIGIRNPKSRDRAPISVTIWANELRVTDFDKKAGWAANANLNAKLADLATVSASAQYTSVGFGTVEQKISERTRQSTLQYSVAGNVALDKLFPDKLGLKIPMYVNYGQTSITPRWDPLDPDIPLSASLQSISDLNKRNEYQSMVQDITTQRGINFTNVRKVKTNPDAKNHIYDIENLSLTYAFSETNQHNVYRAEYTNRSYRGGINYNFNPNPISIEPFKNISLFKGKWLALIHDFNFSPAFSNLNVAWTFDREYVKTQLRNSDLTTIGILPTFEKYFNMSRIYNFRWNLTKSLALNYSAQANATIDEPPGELNTPVKRDSLLTNLRHLGRVKNFNQDIELTYQLPLSKIPLVDWTNADVRYDAGYTWMAGAIDQADSLGNTAQNSRDMTFNGKIDFVKLYNKSKFLREINSPPRSRRPAPTSSRSKADSIQVRQSSMKEVKGFLRILMMLRSVNFSYNEHRGTTLPGFLPRPLLFGMDSSFSSPGWGFILGSQNIGIKQKMIEKGWLARSQYLTYPLTQILNSDLKITGNIEPFPDFRIQFLAGKTQMDNYQEIFRYGPDTLQNGTVVQNPQSLAPTRTGSFSISLITIGTSFIKDDANNNSPTFKKFEDYRMIIQNRLNSQYKGAEYNENSQDVIIPAFLAAYSGRDPAKIGLTSFPKFPLPNWRIDYAGLGKIPALQNIFTSLSLTHSYSSTYNVSNYTNSLFYENNIGLNNSIENFTPGYILNDKGESVPVYVIGEVMISEQFAPLIGINFRTKNKITGRIEYKTERNLTLNISNSQITELDNKDMSFDMGYTQTNLKMPFKINGETVVLKNDIQFRMNLTIRNTRTVQRKIDDLSTITAGNKSLQMRPTIQYMLNDKLNLQFYFERNINDPLISNTFRRTTTSAGVQIRFSLAQ